MISAGLGKIEWMQLTFPKDYLKLAIFVVELHQRSFQNIQCMENLEARIYEEDVLVKMSYPT